MKNIQIVDVSADDPYENIRRMSLVLVDEGIAVSLRLVIGADMCEGIFEQFRNAVEQKSSLRRFESLQMGQQYRSEFPYVSRLNAKL